MSNISLFFDNVGSNNTSVRLPGAEGKILRLIRSHVRCNGNDPGPIFCLVTPSNQNTTFKYITNSQDTTIPYTFILPYNLDPTLTGLVTYTHEFKKHYYEIKGSSLMQFKFSGNSGSPQRVILEFAILDEY